MSDDLGSLMQAMQDSPMGAVPTGILMVLFLIAGLYMVFGQNQGKGTPMVRLVGVLMLVVVGYAVATSLGLQRPF